jgi:methylmalonyl-CoA mutase cobalamin-binding domain/chain
LVVATGGSTIGDRQASRLAEALRRLGVDASYAGEVDCGRRIATAAVEAGAHSVELCLHRGGGGIALLRQLLHELDEMGRRDVSIVVHRIP